MTTHIEYAISIHGHQTRPDDHLDPTELKHLVLGTDETLVHRQVTDWQPV